MLAALERARDVAARRLLAAEQLDDHFDLRIAEDRLRVGRQQGAVDALGPLLGGVAHQRALDDYLGAERLRDPVALARQDREHAAADRADPEDADVDPTHIGPT